MLPGTRSGMRFATTRRLYTNSGGGMGPPPGSPPPYWGQPVPDPYIPTPPKQIKPASDYVKKTPLNKGVCIVPQGELWVVERLGKYSRTLEPGLAMLIPLVDRIAYVHSSKEQAQEIPNQSAITKDNVVVTIDGILFMKIDDAKKASYNVENPIHSLLNVAQTTMRSEIGKLTLDRLFEERSTLNTHIRAAIAIDAETWGITCKRYEIRDIQVSDIVRKSMDLQAEADRKRRKNVLESEGDRDAMSNRATGERRARELMAEAEKVSMVKKAEAEAEKLRLMSEAQAAAIRTVADSIKNNQNSEEAMRLEVAKKYLESFGNIAKTTNTVVLPANMQDPSAMISSAMSVYKALSNTPSPQAVEESIPSSPPASPLPSSPEVQTWTPDMDHPPPPLQ